jgi:hypothetical protein
MKSQDLRPEDVEANFNKYVEYLKKIQDPSRQAAALSVTELLGERLALCPASGRTEHHNCFVGGLVDHSIRVLRNALVLRKTFDMVNDVPLDSVVIAALFHDLGKVGDYDVDYYVPQDSDWHREKLGELYTFNKNLPFMTVPHRSLWLLQKAGLALTQDEFLAIMLHDGQYAEGNKQYAMKERTLVDLIHMADFMACKQEKNGNGEK